MRACGFKDYWGASTFLGKRERRVVPGIRSTSVERIDATTVSLRYHGTRVVDYRPDGTCVLRSGGWRTVTTKSRLNAFSPARVCQRDFSWYLVVGPDRLTVDFHDCMVIDGRGHPVTQAESEAV